MGESQRKVRGFGEKIPFSLNTYFLICWLEESIRKIAFDSTGVQTHTFLICSLQFYPFSHNFSQLTRVDLPLAMPPRRPTSSPFRMVRDTSLSPDFPIFPESFAGFREKAQFCSSKAACLSSTEPSCVGGKIRVSSKWPILTQLNLLSRL